MQGTVLHGARDIRFEDLADPTIVEPTDAIISLSATCICGSDLWPYRGIQPIPQPVPMGHEYCGIVEEVGRGVRGQARAVRDRIVLRLRQHLPALPAGYQTSCAHKRARRWRAGADATRAARRRHSRGDTRRADGRT